MHKMCYNDDDDDGNNNKPNLSTFQMAHDYYYKFISMAKINERQTYR